MSSSTAIRPCSTDRIARARRWPCSRRQQAAASYGRGALAAAVLRHRNSNQEITALLIFSVATEPDAEMDRARQCVPDDRRRELLERKRDHQASSCPSTGRAEAMRGKRKTAGGRGCGRVGPGSWPVGRRCWRRTRAARSLSAGFPRPRENLIRLALPRSLGACDGRSRNWLAGSSTSVTDGDAGKPCHPRAVTGRCSFSSFAPFAMRRWFRLVATRSFASAAAGKACYGARKGAKRPEARRAADLAVGDAQRRGGHRRAMSRIGGRPLPGGRLTADSPRWRQRWAWKRAEAEGRVQTKGGDRKSNAGKFPILIARHATFGGSPFMPMIYADEPMRW